MLKKAEAAVGQASKLIRLATDCNTPGRGLLEKTNKEHLRQQDVKALSEILYGHRSLELWRMVSSAGAMAELAVIENASCFWGERMLEASTSETKKGSRL